jgi:hypothetical protein
VDMNQPLAEALDSVKTELSDMLDNLSDAIDNVSCFT